jgi:hypothetical protein
LGQIGEKQKGNPEYLFQKIFRKCNNSKKEPGSIIFRDFEVNEITAERKLILFIYEVLP